jgi:hypothetical protein
VPEQKRRSLICALETDLCPRTGRLKESGLRRRERPGQLYAGSGEGQSLRARIRYVVEREEASYQTNELPMRIGSSYTNGLAPSPPSQFMRKRSMSKAVERRSMK